MMNDFFPEIGENNCAHIRLLSERFHRTIFGNSALCYSYVLRDVCLGRRQLQVRNEGKLDFPDYGNYIVYFQMIHAMCVIWYGKAQAW